MKIKVKNVFNIDKKIKLLNGDQYTIKSNAEKIVGDYSDESRLYIFDLLKKGFEVSKIENENVLDHMLISEGSRMTSDVNLDESNINNNEVIEKPKKKRGRPKKQK